MKRHVVVVAALAAALVVAVAPEASGKGGTPISSCGQTVTTNAIVTQDLNCPDTPGIVIGADGITIDLNGHIVRGGGYAGGIQDSLFDKLTVKNGTLTNFEDGVVAVNGADGVTVSNVTVSGNVTAGIWVNGSAAKIQSVTASGNGQYAFGVRVIGDFANISSVEADANGTSGIVVTGDSALIQTSTAYGNTANEYGHVGIGITGNAGTIKSSTANGNVTGIAISGDNGTIQSSTANGNSGGGIIVSASSAPATVTSSTANGNRYEGISLNGVDAGVIQGNQANANGFANAGAGIQVFFQIAPTGTNVAHGNADPAECVPANLC